LFAWLVGCVYVFLKTIIRKRKIRDHPKRLIPTNNIYPKTKEMREVLLEKNKHEDVRMRNVHKRRRREKTNIQKTTIKKYRAKIRRFTNEMVTIEDDQLLL